MYGKSRFIYKSFVTGESQISVSSQAPGIVGGAKKSGTGSATLKINAPSPTHTRILHYTVKIDDVSSGKEIGQAKYRWSDGTSGWNATGVTTHSTFQTLNNNIQIAWESGSGDDFSYLDEWGFPAFLPHGVYKMIDFDPNTYYKSKQLDNPNWIRFDLGSPKTVTSVILQYHNFTSSATITLQANSSDTWSSPSFSQTLSWASEVILAYTNLTYRYVRLVIDDPTNPDGYIRIGNVFLGTYLELSRSPRWQGGFLESFRLNGVERRGLAGTTYRKVLSKSRSFRLSLEALTESDVVSLQDLFNTVDDPVSGISRPFFLNVWSDEPTQTYLVRLPLEGFSRSLLFYEANALDLDLIEEPRTYV